MLWVNAKPNSIFTADLYLFAGKAILTSQSLWPLWDLGRIMLS